MFLAGGADVRVSDCDFTHGFAANGNGGSVQVYSAFSLDPNTTTTAHFTRCTFADPSADYLGATVYSAQSAVTVEDTELWPEAVTQSLNIVYEAGGEVSFLSSCPPGSYGSCAAAADGKGYSCEIGVCTVCPAGTIRATPGALGLSDCLPCDEGTYAANPTGAVACETCEAGSFASDEAEDNDGIGERGGGWRGSKRGVRCGRLTSPRHRWPPPVQPPSPPPPPPPPPLSGVTIGASVCVACPSGRFSAESSSTSCVACDLGEAASSGATACSACDPGSYADGERIGGEQAGIRTNARREYGASRLLSHPAPMRIGCASQPAPMRRRDSA